MMMSSGNLMNVTVSRHSISVIVCTRNRAEVLERALESLARQQLRNEIPYEVIVVDNASTDVTPTIVARFEQRQGDPQVKRIVESKVGLSYARNSGLQVARGEIIAFLDDDAVAESTWLQELLDTYVRFPDAWGVGGKTIPKTEKPYPTWFSGKMLRFLGGHDYGPRTLKLTERMSLQGANMSFRRKAFDLVGDFSVSLGRKGNKQFSYEDVEFCLRLRRTGKELYYTPKAWIWHHFPQQRLSMKEIALTRFRGAQSEAVVDQVYFGTLFTLAKSAKKAFSTLFAYPFLIAWNRLRAREDEVCYYWIYGCATAGYILQTFRQLLRFQRGIWEK